MTDRRRRELARIHIDARKLCGNDREAYEDMLEAIVGQRSSKDLDQAGRAKVLRHLAACKAVAPEKRRLIAKIDALLIDAGNLPRSYAEGILRTMTRHSHRAKLEWAAPPLLVKVVAALEIQKRRRLEGAEREAA